MSRNTAFLFALSVLCYGPLSSTTWAQSRLKTSFTNQVTITVEGDYRFIRSNGIPNHQTGQFPGAGNPNTISAQSYEFRVPANPKPADHPTKLRMQPFGVAVNGVVFDPFAAEWWDGDPSSGWQYEPMAPNGNHLGIDKSNAHVQPNGAYHYHGVPQALVYALSGGQPKMELIGWAADGFPIYNPLGYSNASDVHSALRPLKSSYRIKKGTRPDGPGGAYNGLFVEDYEYVAGSGDLDEFNGVSTPTPEYPQGTYHYVVTEQFPYIPRMYRGTPDRSFFVHGGPGGGAGRGNPPGGDGRGRSGRPPLPQVVTAIDANGDGILDADEIAHASESLKKLDKNGYGQLTFDEYGPPRPPNGRGAGGLGNGGRGRGGPDNGRRPPPLIIRALDANGDGIISAEEIANAPAALKKLDKNGDGKLTFDEYMGPPPGGRRGQAGQNGDHDNEPLPAGYPPRQ